MAATKQQQHTPRASAKTAAPATPRAPAVPAAPAPIPDTPPPPPEVSATFAPDVPDEARLQRANETPAGRGVVIPTASTETPTDG